MVKRIALSALFLSLSILFSGHITLSLAQTCTDNDSDGFGNPSSPACTYNMLDCDDTDGTVYPYAPHYRTACDAKDTNCDGRPDYATDKDSDGDGYLACDDPRDCNDNDPAINPGATETPPGGALCTDGIDNDCDWLIDGQQLSCQSPCYDRDGDGYYDVNSDPLCTQPTDDCVDNNAGINPGVPDDNCNNIDENCSGTADDQYVAPIVNCGTGECANTGLDECRNGVVMFNCTPLPPGIEGPPGDPTCGDGLDNNCNGYVDDLCLDACGGCCPTGIPDSNCDGLDDDCNGLADDLYVPTPTNCGDGECTATGQLECQGGAEVDTCVAGTPVAEVGIPTDPICSDGLDNDCDTIVDECGGCNDQDSDGFGNPANTLCTYPMLDCDDSDPMVYPYAPHYRGVCDAKDTNCDGVLDFPADRDSDSDGYKVCDLFPNKDCNDNDAAINPGQQESSAPPASPICNDGIDNDCNWLVDDCAGDPCIDQDADSYYSVNSDPVLCLQPMDDCDDNDGNIHPGVPDDDCNNIDENCSGTPDDQYAAPPTNCGTGICSSTGSAECQGGVIVDTCVPGPAGTEDSPDPLAPECNDGLDNDCDGTVDECYCAPTGLPDDNCDGIDDDCNGIPDDGYVSPPVLPCGTGECTASVPCECIGGAEICYVCTPNPPGQEGPAGDPSCFDGLDNDCDGLFDIDDPDCVAGCVDNDSDGFGVGDITECPYPVPDCDDNDPMVYPFAPHYRSLCDAKDTNCDGILDFPTDRDNDSDGYKACDNPKDCNDNDSTVNPGQPEDSAPPSNPICSDGIDNDCDWIIDECPGDPCYDQDGDGYYSVNSDPACTNPMDDCDDNNTGINPGVPDDNCNNIDENCSGTPDEQYVSQPTSCGAGICASTGSDQCIGGVIVDDCVPGPAGTEDNPVPAAPECNDSLDNDCDGTVDECGCTPTGLPDDNCNGIDDDCNGTPDDSYPVTPTQCGVGICLNSGQLECQSGVEVDTCVPLPPGNEDYPFSAPECSDGLDNDCDSIVDECPVGCNDMDGDGFGCPGSSACTYPLEDCDCSDPLVHPFSPHAALVCDGKDTNCDGILDFPTDKDDDGDGYKLCDSPKDCADLPNGVDGIPGTADDGANINPGVTVGPAGDITCLNGLDNDCDWEPDYLQPGCIDPCGDADSDGYYDVNSHPACTNPMDDCDDSNAGINPGVPDDNCNNIDENCSGTPDDGYTAPPTSCGLGICTSTGIDDCQNGVIVDTCTPGIPATEGPIGDPTCVDGLDNDCDSTFDDPVSNPVNPDLDCNQCVPTGQPDDNCDGVDDDCNGTADDLYVATPTQCGIGECTAAGLLECQGGVQIDTCVPLPPGIEGGLCGDPSCTDGLDNDCDTQIDECYCGCWDMDSDGFGDPASVFCTYPLQDCDDNDPMVYPFAPHYRSVCDGKDTNCDGIVDYPTDVDSDSDGYKLCDTPNDCDDTNATINPGASEGPPGSGGCSDGRDNDCDSLIDLQDCSCSDPCLDNDGDGYFSMNSPCSATCTSPTDDCDDNDPNVNPGIAEEWQNPPTCQDGVDNDCDFLIDLQELSCQSQPCVLDSECQPAEYCAKADSDCGGQGTCTQVTTIICATVYIPVCGCDGQTYSNDCYAENAGVNIDYGGECTACGVPAQQEGPPGDPTCTDTLDNDCDGLVDEQDPECIGSYTLIITSGVAHTTGGIGGGGMGDVPVSGTFRLHISGITAAMEDIEISDDPSMLDWNTLNGTLAGIDLYLFAPYTNPSIPIDTVFQGSFNSSSLSMTGNHSDPFVDGFNYDYDISATLVRDDDADGYCNSADPACTDSNVIDCDDTDPNINPGVSEGPSGDPTCSDTLDNDCDGLADWPDPDCADAADAPHDIITDCTVCHDPGTYVVGATLDNNKCLACHDGATATLVETHHTPADLNCTDCHNVMRPQSNLKHIRGIISGIPVIFTAPAGANSFADGDGTYDGICEVCHTQTTHHQNDGSAPGGQSHQDGTDCTTCHSHQDGFNGVIVECFGPHDFITDCAICHDPGTYVLNPSIPDSRCQICHDAAAPGAAGGGADTKVETHSGSTYAVFSANCVECHNDHCNSNNLKLVRSTIAGSAVPGSQITFTAYTGPGSFSDGPPYSENICDTCHTLTNHHRYDGVTGSHNDGTDCTVCHSHINAYDPQ